MRSGFVFLLSLLALPAAGAPLLLHPAFRRYGAAARIVLAGAAGAYAISLAMTLFSLAGVPWRLPLLVVAGIAIGALLRLLVPSGAAIEPPPRERLGTLEWAAIAVTGIALAAAAAAAFSGSATSPDLLLFWGPKAEAFAAARGFDADYLGDPIHAYQHVSYPPLVPSLYAFGAIACGRFPWMAPVVTFPLLLAALAVALPGTLRNLASRRNALMATAAIAASLGFLGDDLDIAGNADSALLLFEVLATAILLAAPRDDSASELLAGILLGGACAAKVEGLPFTLTAAALFLGIRRGSGFASMLGRRLRLLLPSAAALAAWLAYGASRHLFRGYESYGPLFHIHTEALAPALGTTARSLFGAGAGLPWLIPMAALLASGRGTFRPRAIVPLAMAAILAAFFLFTYVHLADPTLLIQWSAGRIFSILSPLFVLAALAAFASPAAREERGRP